MSTTDTPKMIRETLCVAQAAVSDRPLDHDRKAEHIDRLGRLIAEVDRQRPLGPDGKHGDRHTPECGCEDVPDTERDERLRGAREAATRARTQNPPLGIETWLIRLDDEVTRLDAVVTAVREVHQPKTRTISVPVFDQWDSPTQVQHGCSCGHYTYPCPTVRALDGGAA